MRKRFLVLLLIFSMLLTGVIVTVYVRHQHSQINALLHLPKLEIGDWVVRMGTVNDSRWISYLGKSEYSHIGMIIATEPNVKVIHATTNDEEEYSDQVIISDLDHFLSPQLATKGAIIRPLFLTSQQKQQIANLLLTQRGKPFILASRNTSHLYCTTLLFDSIRQIEPSFDPKWTLINYPIFEGEYLFPQSFINYPNTQVIFQIRYQ